MPNVKNPNKPSKNRLAARASKIKKQRRTRAKRTAHAAALLAEAEGAVEEKDVKAAKADLTRGARPGLMPTSGPRARLSGKKARKMEKKMGYAARRRMEAEGEVVMEDVPEDEDELCQEEMLQRDAAGEMEGIQ